MKVVGMVGDSGDINATVDRAVVDHDRLHHDQRASSPASGSRSAAPRSSDKFVTSAFNAWVRITAVTATSLTFDNLPSGWTTETGTGLTIKLWFGDYIRNGTTATSLSIEKGFLDQTVPTYIVNTGMQVNDLNLDITSKSEDHRLVQLHRHGRIAATTTLDASPDAVSTGLVMAANANVGRIAENNSTLTSPNWAQKLSIKYANNLRTLEAVDSTSPVGVNPGEFVASGEINTYFGDNSLLAKLYNATSTSINCRVTKTTASVPQALVFTFPTVYLRGGGNPQAGGKNRT
jgi:hypothetical protein